MEPLYGRTEILTRARAWLERACAGAGRLVLFTGEPGIGKSRLAEQVALEAAALGAASAWGRCWEAGGAPAYWPWIQVFRELDMNEDPFAGAGAGLAVGAPEARFAAFDGAVRSLRELAARRPLLLVLDDLHAADAPSLLLLLMLARALPRAPILVIGAYRDAELQLTPELAPLLAKIAREAEVVPLPRLDAADVASWLRDTGSEDSAQDAADLYRVTEGHPLFVAEALKLGRGAAAHTAWALGPRGVLDERLSRLTAATRAVLEVAAVLGREFALDEVAEAAPVTLERTHDSVHQALREAVATNIVVPVGLGRYRFSHVLLRDRLYAELLPSVRSSVHFQAGSASLARGGSALSAVHHLFEGARAGTSQQVAEVALRAAEASLSRLAFEDAARIARRARELPDAGALSDTLRAQLLVLEAEALINLGESARGKAQCLEAAALAERCQSPELRARAALVYATELASGTIDPQMVALLRDALHALPTQDSSLRARVLARLAAALTPPQRGADGPEVLALMQEALAMARRLPQPHALLYALQFSATVGLLVPELERFAHLRETLSLARSLDQPLVVLQVLPTYITALLAVGRRDEAEALMPEYGERLGDSRQPVHRVRYLLVRSLLATLSGDYAEAESLDAEARVLAHGSGSRPAFFLFLTHRMSLAQLRGEPALLAPDGAAFLEHFSTLHGARAYVAWFCAGTGRAEEALARMAALDMAAPEIPSANLWELSGGAETCVLLGDTERGARLYPEFERAADRMFWNTAPGALIGPSARALGDLARLLGRFDDAVRHYDAAIAFCEKLRAPRLVAQCQRARAAALQRADGARDPAAPAPARAPSASQAVGALTLEREGELWCLRTAAGASVRLKHGKGFAYLQYLLQHPGRDVHVLELAGIEHRAGDAGPVLDAQAKAAYRARLAALHDERDEAERFGDAARLSRAEHELQSLEEELARAVGLGGRDRRAASDVERVRINVQRRLKDAIERIAAVEPNVGRYLAAAIKTGTSCVYQPV